MKSGDAAAAWQTAHEALVQLGRKRAGLDFEEGRWLLAARRAKAHQELGYGSFTEYAERLFGYPPRLTHDKLRVAEAFEKLPELARELREGAVTFSQVRELTRVATADTEKAWLERARGLHLASGRKARFGSPAWVAAGLTPGAAARAPRPSLRGFGRDFGYFSRSCRAATP
jgi:hypothetical protein